MEMNLRSLGRGELQVGGQPGRWGWRGKVEEEKNERTEP
jgi:hypothetical protein